MKILHLLSDSRFTGPAQPVLQLVEELLRRGHDVQIGCNRRPPSWRISKRIKGEGHFLFFARRLKQEPVGDFEKEIRQANVPLVEQLDLNRYFNVRDNVRNFYSLRDILRDGKYVSLRFLVSWKLSDALLSQVREIVENAVWTER